MSVDSEEASVIEVLDDTLDEEAPSIADNDDDKDVKENPTGLVQPPSTEDAGGSSSALEVTAVAHSMLFMLRGLDWLEPESRLVMESMAINLLRARRPEAFQVPSSGDEPDPRRDLVRE